MKPLLISSGEPAGIGPDVCLALANSDIPVVVMGDRRVLAARAALLNLPICFEAYETRSHQFHQPNHLTILSYPCAADVVAGALNVLNVPYVLNMLTESANRCLSGEFSALVTAPVHKAIINQAGFEFTGHTEFFAHFCQVEQVVMLLACREMKVALVTTHIPLREVATAVTSELLFLIIRKVHQGLQRDFGITNPKIFVAGLNPHAGEAGFLGREEIDVISPTLYALQQQGIDVHGPIPADTLFTPRYLDECDVVVAMYHDQGLPALKYASFGHAVNVTLGLPLIRTSVDHGTALDLAGTGLADSGSLLEAVAMAATMVGTRQ